MNSNNNHTTYSDETHSIECDKQFFNITLREWVITIHNKIRKKYKSPKFSINEDEFGFDAYLHILENVLSIIDETDISKYIQKKLNYKKFIEPAHFGWSNNYIYWKNKYYDDINSDECNDRATTLPRNLCKEDIKMYKNIINEIFSIVSTKIIECGINSMKM